MLFTIYILRCSDGSYYTGLTRMEAEQRLWQHNEGIVDSYTYSRRPVELVFTETTDSSSAAVARERQIKGWSREKKEALIAGDWERLAALSKNRQHDP
ncbi:GIY-YIG nuclease family protein [Devosia submarina]|uniref:GIY-YIG nuclease family protein n=1 Tax=Devosia submarina TaxID=1173082 RepID=UPI000D38DAA3|nr:GIY-YIG nuclease family protein [Devosia submarina]